MYKKWIGNKTYKNNRFKECNVSLCHLFPNIKVANETFTWYLKYIYAKILPIISGLFIPKFSIKAREFYHFISQFCSVNPTIYNMKVSVRKKKNLHLKSSLKMDTLFILNVDA